MFISRTTLVLLSVFLAAPAIAGDPSSYTFEKCRTQTQCRLVSQAELGRLRGGFSLTSAGGAIEISFGIVQAVFINNQLVALTQLVGPGAGQVLGTLSLSSAQMQALNAALQGRAPAIPLTSSGARGANMPGATSSSGMRNAPSAAAGTSPAGNAPQALTQGAAPTGFKGTPGATQTLATPPLTAGFNGTPSGPTGAGTSVQRASGSVASASSSVTASAAQAPSAPTVLANGTAVTPGNPVINVPTAAGIRSLTIQNGPGNIAFPNAADIRNATMTTVIQNTLDGQTIRAATLMNVSLGLTKAMTASALQNAISQGMATVGR
jgi:hypothetical protein